jgi:hypothetical protein
MSAKLGVLATGAHLPDLVITNEQLAEPLGVGPHVGRLSKGGMSLSWGWLCNRSG